MTELELTCAVADHVSLAYHQNSIPVISEVKLDNKGEAALSDVEVLIACDPPVIAPLTIRIEQVAAGGIHYIRAPDLRLDAAMLRSMSEGARADLVVVARQAGEKLAHVVAPLRVLPASHWGGVGSAPELLAAFVRPNDPAVDVILHEASKRLAAAGKPSGLDGYGSGRRDRAWDVAAAIWAAVAALGLTYVLPPASFERTGQKVRSPSDVLERRTATCLDTTLLFAACYEQAGLDPLLVLTQGHAFVGLWLGKADLQQALVDDGQVIRKRRDGQELVLVETTLVTHRPPARFSEAVRQGASQVDEDAAAPFELALDVRRARMRQIRPLDLGTGAKAPETLSPDAPPVDLGLDEPPLFIDETAVAAEPDRPDDRLERWKRKLLDLTAKNKLLNFKDARKAIEVEVPDAGRLEDMLSGGTKFRFLPRSDVLDGTDGRHAGLHRERHGDDGRRAFLGQALEAGDLHTRLGADDLDARLTELFRLSRTAFEEGGSNVLYLALGFLTWVQSKGGKSYRAPILLIPVALKRRSVRGGFRMELLDEEARFNPTLVEMLRQDFDLRMPEFERDLPTDASGLAVDKIWQGLRHHVKDLKGWEVTADVAMSTFSFTKFLMWRDLVDRVEALKANPVVRHLIDTPKHSYGDGSPMPEPRDIDRHHHPRDVFAPLSADSSQLAAVMAAAAGRDFVLHGPPGTGKSQTIANMIAQCLAAGRTVLFVSQKTAALEVVQRRLRDIGLGSYCLEVHSTKAQKSAVLTQLKAAWHDRQPPTAEAWEAATEDLAQLRDELNRLVASLHRRHDNGLTPHEAFGRVVANRDAWPGLRLGWDGLDREPAPLDRLRALCREVETALRAVGSPATHPLRGLATCDWTPAWRDAFGRAADAQAAALPHVAQAGTAFAATLGFQDLPTDWEVLPALAAFGAVLASGDARLGASFLSQSADAWRRALATLAEIQSRAVPVQGRLRGAWRDAVYGLDLRAKLGEWTQATASNVLVRGGRQKKVRDGFAPYADEPTPADLGHDLVALIELSGLRAEAAELGRAFTGTDVPWHGLDTDGAALARGSAWADAARGVVAALSEVTGHAPDALRDYVLTLVADYPDLFAPDGAARRAHAELVALLDAARRASADLAGLAGLDASDRPLVEGPDWVSESLALAAGWKAALNRAQPWCYWNRAARDARAAGLGAIVDGVAEGLVAPDAVEAAFVAAHARWWADVAVGADPVLSGFVAERHADAIRRFQAADERVGELAKRIVAARLRGDVPAPNAFGADPEWGTLSHEMVKRARHLPIRQLFSRIPTALTRLTPCVMMSPLSIAQYLPAESRPFDLVIFDEASQIPVWDAIGAIARGRQVVVVGDPEQLPPTSVGERGVDEVEDGIDVEDQESILDECLAANIPSRRLDWHYRSRDESLIAFSNGAYYGGHLVTFPSPSTVDRAVRLVPVPAGVYQRGKDRINVREAEAVVPEVVRRLKEPAFAAERLSLGVVTFNGQQQRLIENLLDRAQVEHPDILPFFDAQRWHEPVFVKNLENVQGDERDIILFSVTFAPDEAGRQISVVSSLNSDGGHRRLNVAITRARREMAVFATLRPDQISLSGKGSRGIRDFKHFLEFAERGPRALVEAAAPLGRGTDSPFEDAVLAALEADGWTVHPQVGVSAFRIDLGIVHPDAPAATLPASNATAPLIIAQPRRATATGCARACSSGSAGASAACGAPTGGWMPRPRACASSNSCGGISPRIVRRSQRSRRTRSDRPPMAGLKTKMPARVRAAFCSLPSRNNCGRSKIGERSSPRLRNRAPHPSRPSSTPVKRCQPRPRPKERGAPSTLKPTSRTRNSASTPSGSTTRTMPNGSGR